MRVLAIEDIVLLFLNMATFENDPNAPIAMYFLIRAVDDFHAAHGRFPGTAVADEHHVVEADAQLLRPFVNALLAQYDLDSDVVSSAWLHEMCRFGATEMHNIGAFLGGIVAQEAIKLITKQYTPLNNTFLFNGVHGLARSVKV